MSDDEELARLNKRVTIAICRAEQTKDPADWALVSDAEEAIARHLPISTVEGIVGRGGAVAAALKAQLLSRVVSLADEFLLEVKGVAKLEHILRRDRALALQSLNRERMIACALGFPARWVPPSSDGTFTGSHGISVEMFDVPARFQLRASKRMTRLLEQIPIAGGIGVIFLRQKYHPDLREYHPDLASERPSLKRLLRSVPQDDRHDLVEDWVDAWHECETELSLAQWMGLTDMEYARFVETPSYILEET